MRRSIIILIVFCFFSGTKLSAQEGPYPSSGIGIIAPEKGINSVHINFPLAEIKLYASPDQKPCGIIIRKNSLNLIYKVVSKPVPLRVNNKDLAEIEYAGYCLKYFERQGDFVKVLVNSAGKGYWLSLSELNYLHFVPRTWMDILLETKKFFYPQVDVGINLRVKPDPSSKKITLIKGNHYAISLSGETDGLWTAVTVGRYSAAPCKDLKSTPVPIEEWTGWLKAIDDAGYPNIWFFPRGCR
jgi:hypothetical protein